MVYCSFQMFLDRPHPRVITRTGLSPVAADNRPVMRSVMVGRACGQGRIVSVPSRRFEPSRLISCTGEPRVSLVLATRGRIRQRIRHRIRHRIHPCYCRSKETFNGVFMKGYEFNPEITRFDGLGAIIWCLDSWG